MIETLKERQKLENNKSFGDREFMVFEQNHFHDHLRKIPFKKLKKLLDRNGINLDNKNLLISSCGRGVDVHHLKKYYDANFFVTDLAENAVKLVKNTFKDVSGQVEDNENLSFSDDTFDYTYVKEALHHLPRPILGLYELLRVGKNGVIVMEPNDSFITRIATRLGLAQKIEGEGNYVYRISKRDVEKIANSMFLEFDVIRCWAIHRVAKSQIEFMILRLINRFMNTFFAKEGNYIIFLIKKNS